MPSLPPNPSGERNGDSSLAPPRLLLVNQGGDAEVGSDLSRGKPGTSSRLIWTEKKKKILSCCFTSEPYCQCIILNSESFDHVNMCMVKSEKLWYWQGATQAMYHKVPTTLGKFARPDTTVAGAWGSGSRMEAVFRPTWVLSHTALRKPFLPSALFLLPHSCRPKEQVLGVLLTSCPNKEALLHQYLNWPMGYAVWCLTFHH